MNVMMLLDMGAQGFGERIAFSNGDKSLSYQALFEAAGRAVSAIDASACAHVAMLDVSSLATPIALFGSAWAGVPYVPLNYRLTRSEIEALLARVEPAMLITSADRQSEFESRQLQVLSQAAFLVEAESGVTTVRDWSMDQQEVGVLLFTSGTSGAPKAAVLRQKHLVSYVLGAVEFMSAGEEEAALVCVPPYHIAGISAVLSSVYAGRRVVQLPDFSATAWIELVKVEQVTHAFVVPTMLARIVEAFSTETIGDDAQVRLPSLRALAYGGGKMPLSVIERAMQLFPNVEFTNAYGLTETSSTISLLGPGEHREAAASDDAAVRRRLVSVGRALPGVEVEIRGEKGELLGPGQRGEITVRGEQVSGEYVGQDSLLDSEGWFPTRDAGFMDADGYLFLEGRIDDVIVRSGENMSPGEIEDVLLEHPAVGDVAVVGVPDEQWGEAVAAVVVLKPGQEADVEALQAWVREQLRGSRVPQLMAFWPELPYTETGKLLRRIVKASLSNT